MQLYNLKGGDPMASIKKTRGELGAPSDKKKNRYLKPDGGINLIEKFPGIDYLKYSIKKGKKSRKR